MPAASTRAAGEREASPRRQASSHLPPAARASTTSGSVLRPSPRQAHARSRITARATMEQAASGIMTGPPLTSRARIALIARSPPTSTDVASEPPSSIGAVGAGSVAGWPGRDAGRAGWLLRQDQLVRLRHPQVILLPAMDDDDLALTLQQGLGVDPARPPSSGPGIVRHRLRLHARSSLAALFRVR